MIGTLYIVATPIGNLEDITMRAVRVLRECAVIACEDTRQTRKLLEHFHITTPLVSYHEHNEEHRAGELAARLLAGEDVALVSDAGTPLVSDPGYRLVHDALKAGVRIAPIPGVSAVIAALSASGLPTDSFRFCGFLPPKSSQRLKILHDLAPEACTLIFYETPHRILDALEDIETALGPRPVVLARELTKLYEEFLRGTAMTIREQLASRPSVKGEITLLIGKSEARATHADISVEDAVRSAEAGGLTRMDAIKRVAKERGLGKREVYGLMTENKKT